MKESFFSREETHKPHALDEQKEKRKKNTTTIMKLIDRKRVTRKKNGGQRKAETASRQYKMKNTKGKK